MRNLVFIAALLILSACHSSRHSNGDYSRNSSNSKKEVTKSSRKKKSKKHASIEVSGNASEAEYLDPLSGSSSSMAKEDRDSESNDNRNTIEGTSRLLTNDMIREADKLIGVVYRYGGTSPQRGFDCSGFTSYVFDKINIDIPRTSTDQSQAGKRKNFDDADVGDLVFFGTGSRVTHVGIVVERTNRKLEVIHSTSSAGVRKDEIFGSEYWRSRALWAVDFKSLGTK